MCVWRVIKRWAKYRGSARPDMGSKCKECFDTEFLRYVWNFNKSSRMKIMNLLSATENKEIIVIHGKRELKKYIGMNYYV